MSTAHDHYREAERLIKLGGDVYADPDNVDDPDARAEAMRDATYFVAEAQVHATLALAAASGANRPAVEKPDVRTIADPPAHGDLIIDQMGDTPAEGYCGVQLSKFEGDDCVERNGHDGPHIDPEGRKHP
jgi:hypothetical protein